jgi:hypothetical protein
MLITTRRAALQFNPLRLQQLNSPSVPELSSGTRNNVGTQFVLPQVRSSLATTMSAVFQRSAAGKLESAPPLITGTFIP